VKKYIPTVISNGAGIVSPINFVENIFQLKNKILVMPTADQKRYL
jgi:hypothetical protein